jgi:hypothetical protein
VADVEAMTIGKAGYDLSEQADGFFFGEGAVAGYVVEKLATFDILQYKVSIGKGKQGLKGVGVFDAQLSPIFPDIVEIDNVRMLNELHDYDFSLNAEWHQSKAGC